MRDGIDRSRAADSADGGDAHAFFCNSDVAEQDPIPRPYRDRQFRSTTFELTAGGLYPGGVRVAVERDHPDLSPDRHRRIGRDMLTILGVIHVSLQSARAVSIVTNNLARFAATCTFRSTSAVRTRLENTPSRAGCPQIVILLPPSVSDPRNQCGLAGP